MKIVVGGRYRVGPVTKKLMDTTGYHNEKWWGGVRRIVGTTVTIKESYGVVYNENYFILKGINQGLFKSSLLSIEPKPSPVIPETVLLNGVFIHE